MRRNGIGSLRASGSLQNLGMMASDLFKWELARGNVIYFKWFSIFANSFTRTDYVKEQRILCLRKGRPRGLQNRRLCGLLLQSLMRTWDETVLNLKFSSNPLKILNSLICSYLGFILLLGHVYCKCFGNRTAVCALSDLYPYTCVVWKIFHEQKLPIANLV